MSKKTFIFLVSGLLIGLGFSFAQAAPTFQTSPTIASTTSGIIFVGSPTHYIDWAEYDGNAATATYAATAGTATNADAVDGYSLNQSVMTTGNPQFASVKAVSGSGYSIIGATASGGYLQANNSAGTPQALIRGYAASGVQAYFLAGSIGIGTSAPGYSLDVQGGEINASDGLCIEGDCRTSWSAVGGQWTTSGTNIYNSNDGNVGIGTTAPGSKLSVYTTSSALNVDAIVHFGGAYGNNFYFRPQLSASAYNPIVAAGDFGLIFDKSSNNGNLVIAPWSSTESGIRISASSTNPIIELEGNVGIGTAAPTAKLMVVPTSGYAINTGGFKIGNVGVPTANADAATKGYVDSTIASATSSSALWGGSISGNIRSLNSGNVGIGTTNPYGKLTVSGAIQAGAGESNTTNISTWTSLNSNYGLAGPLGYWGLRTDTSHGINFDVYNGGTQKVALTISQNSNVGIGTTSPSRLLSVHKSSVGEIGLFEDGAQGILLQTTSGVGSVIGYDGSSYNALDLRSTSGAGTGIYLPSTGNVGIGKTAPAGTIDVVSAATTNGYWLDGKAAMTGESTDNWLRLNPSSSWTNGIYTPSILRVDGEFRQGSTDAGSYGIQTSGTLYSAATTSLAVSGGNVGIGTTAPNADLTITTNGTSGGKISFRTDRTDSVLFEDTYTINLKSANGLNFDYDGNSNATGAFNIYEAATSRFYIAAGGKVGIGTTAPSYKLDVVGDIRATSFIYTSSDAGLKKNIATITDPLAKIEKLRGVTFSWKNNNEPSVGLIAQEVEKVFPELVSDSGGTKSLQYSALVAPLIEAVKEQQREIRNLEVRLQALESR